MFLLDASSMMFNMQTDRPAADEVVVRLSYDEAFILSEMLDCWYQAGFDQLYEIADRAERRLLDDLCASFEPVVDEVFAADYLDVLAAARRRLVPPEH